MILPPRHIPPASRQPRVIPVLSSTFRLSFSGCHLPAFQQGGVLRAGSATRCRRGICNSYPPINVDEGNHPRRVGTAHHSSSALIPRPHIPFPRPTVISVGWVLNPPSSLRNQESRFSLLPIQALHVSKGVEYPVPALKSIFFSFTLIPRPHILFPRPLVILSEAQRSRKIYLNLHRRRRYLIFTI